MKTSGGCAALPVQTSWQSLGGVVELVEIISPEGFGGRSRWLSSLVGVKCPGICMLWGNCFLGIGKWGREMTGGNGPGV